MHTAAARCVPSVTLSCHVGVVVGVHDHDALALLATRRVLHAQQDVVLRPQPATTQTTAAAGVRGGGEGGRGGSHGKGYEAALRLLLQAGADKDQADEDGATPVSIAADKGHEAALRLEAGADANAACQGWTPLKIAEHYKHAGCVALLGRHGAK